MAGMTLLESMLEGGSVRTIGPLTLLVFGRGRGSLVTSAFEFSGVRKWADGRSATGIEYRDVNVFMGRFDTCVGRSGSSIPTKGHPANLLVLAKEMRLVGMELSEWSWPNEVREALKPPKPHVMLDESEDYDFSFDDEKDVP